MNKFDKREQKYDLMAFEANWHNFYSCRECIPSDHLDGDKLSSQSNEHSASPWPVILMLETSNRPLEWFIRMSNQLQFTSVALGSLPLTLIWVHIVFVVFFWSTAIETVQWDWWCDQMPVFFGLILASFLFTLFH